MSKDFDDLLGLQSLAPDEQLKAASEIGRLVFESALQRVIADFDDATAKEMEALMAQKPEPQQVLGFLALKAPNFQKVLEEEATRFKQTTVDVLGDLK